MTATDIRYGRRGGTWLPDTGPVDDTTCATCRRLAATHIARSATNPEEPAWRVCRRCATQARRVGAAVHIHPLEQESPCP